MEVLVQGSEDRLPLRRRRELVRFRSPSANPFASQHNVASGPCEGAPGAGTTRAKRITGDQGIDPLPRDDRHVENCERCSVVLEALPTHGPPDRHKVVPRCYLGRTRRSQPKEHDVTPAKSLSEYEEWQNGFALWRHRMQPGKGVPEQHVAAAPSRVQLPAWRLVVAKVGEPPGLRIERVRPIWVGSARVQGDKLASRPRAARVSESTLVADWKQPSQGIVSRVAGTPAAVRGVHEQIRVVDVLEGDLARWRIPPDGSHCVRVAVPAEPPRDSPGWPVYVRRNAPSAHAAPWTFSAGPSMRQQVTRRWAQARNIRGPESPYDAPMEDCRVCAADA